MIYRTKERLVKKKKKMPFVLKTYEYGAHFIYKELQRKLLELFETLPIERLGDKGIYFQESKINTLIKTKLPILYANQLYTTSNDKILNVSEPNKKVNLFLQNMKIESNVSSNNKKHDMLRRNSNNKPVVNKSFKPMQINDICSKRLNHMFFNLNRNKLSKQIKSQNPTHNNNIRKYLKSNSELSYYERIIKYTSHSTLLR